jgi:monoamine oxidase
VSRTPLFATLQRAMRLAAASTRKGAPPLDELADPGFSRRTLLRGTGAASVVAALPVRTTARTRTDARVAVVGGGIAGLVAAYRLRQAGVRDVTVYEANRRSGGRILSGRNVVGQGSLVELGGSFINTDHTDMLELAQEFSLALEDGAEGPDAALETTFFIERQSRSLTQIAEAARDLMGRLEAIKAGPEAAKEEYDSKSAAQVMDELRVSGWLRKLLDEGLTQEMGAEPGAMSSLYLIDYFAPDPAQPKNGLFSSDQRFQISGGNDRVPAALAERLGDRVRLGARLESVRRRGSAYALSFGAREVRADIVVMTLPATMLRGVALDVGLSPLSRRAIRELGYGSNAKLFAGVSARPWRAMGRSGECLNDFGFQTCWEDHGAPGTGAGALTIFAGGATGRGFGASRPADRARDVTAKLDAAFPGTAAAFTGAASRMHWPSNPYVGASYSCLAPGQWTGFPDVWAPVQGFVFAGEHTSEKYSGYMNGGAQSGRQAAEAVVRLLR